MRQKVSDYLDDPSPALWDELTTMEQNWCIAKGASAPAGKGPKPAKKPAKIEPKPSK